MRFHADLHLHSRFSRATSRTLDLPTLALWAARKGLAVIGTGDFTHPAWFSELSAELVEAEPGLYRLAPEAARHVEGLGPAATETRFLLTVEISTIYKKDGATRKVHHVIHAPSLAAAERLSRALARIGNIASDGRPILGLDSRDLLELVLDSDPGSYLIPAHIWTPWFSVLGSKSGFDSVAAAYGDLSDHIFAVETGLSSDPEMNWRVSMLDRYRLVSNSDAHSPSKLGREATTFDCALDYYAIRRALESGAGYVGTVEFFPEEGKYHLDGHRACEVRLAPEETRALDGRCPACGRPVTLGVLHRVAQLADRPADNTYRPPTAGAVSSLVPLAEILGELGGCGAASRRVGVAYDRLTARFGGELAILAEVPLDDLAAGHSPLLAEALGRLRSGAVRRDAGYDGEYGRIRLFDPDELATRTGGDLLFAPPPTAASPTRGHRPRAAPTRAAATPASAAASPAPPTAGAREVSDARPPALRMLDPDQAAAAAIVDRPVMVVAGPGAGKTRTLVHRIAHLIADHGLEASQCLAVTFTRRATEELQARLVGLLGTAVGARVAVHSFHSLALAILRADPAAAGLTRGVRVIDGAEAASLVAAALGVTRARGRTLLVGRAAWLRRAAAAGDGTDAAADDVRAATAALESALAAAAAIDLDGLVARAVATLGADPARAAAWQARFPAIAVDEYQDVDPVQDRLIRLIAPPETRPRLCVIGDADQAIYGFRGADPSCFGRFCTDYPGAVRVTLARNYRSQATIVAAAAAVIAGARGERAPPEPVRPAGAAVGLHVAATEAAEAAWVAATAARLIGGCDFLTTDDEAAERALSFADIAVLYRTAAQAPPVCEALARAGLPFRRHDHVPLAETATVRGLMARLDDAIADQGLRPALRAAAARAAAAAADAQPDGETARGDLAGRSLLLARLETLAASVDDDPDRFREALALMTDDDLWDPRADRITLMTMHAAKGLEFRVVFLVGFEQGLVPLTWDGTPGGDGAGTDDDEERRLAYVALTRAGDRLLVSRTATRVWRGSSRSLPPSPYLAALPSSLTAADGPAVPKPRRARQLALF